MRRMLIFIIKQDICIYVHYSWPNGWTDWAEFFCGHSCEAGECLRLNKIRNFFLQHFFFENFFKHFFTYCEFVHKIHAVNLFIKQHAWKASNPQKYSLFLNNFFDLSDLFSFFSVKNNLVLMILLSITLTITIPVWSNYMFFYD